MWEFRKGNTFGATAFGSYGAFWLAYAAYARFVAGSLQPPRTRRPACSC
ncbi:GPR1/FUN34/YaaH family transporter [Streptomyces sp. NPDC007901]